MSIRLIRATDQLVTAEARRTRRSKSAAVSAFTEETARTRRFPRAEQAAWRDIAVALWPYGYWSAAGKGP